MKILAFNFNGILDDVMATLHKQGHELLDHQDKWKEADVIVVWQETELGGAKAWVKKVQKAGKRVVLLQHGRRGTSRIFPPFNEELISDELCAWGEADRERMIKCGVPKEKIHVTGTPILRRVKSRLKHKGINVVFSPEHWDMEVPENMEVRDALRKYNKTKRFWQPKLNIITKILEGEHNPNDYDNPVSSNRQDPNHLFIATEVLRKADAVVAVSESTFELLAEIIGIPVIIADIWKPKACAGDDRYKEYEREYSRACEKVQDMDKLGQVVLKNVKNPELLQAAREQVAVEDGGVDIADPIQEIINVICGNSKA